MSQGMTWGRCIEAGQEMSRDEGNYLFRVPLRSSDVTSTRLSKNHVGNYHRASMRGKCSHKQVQQGSTGQPCMHFCIGCFTDRERPIAGLHSQHMSTLSTWKMNWLLRKQKGRDWHRRCRHIWREATVDWPWQWLWAAGAKEDRQQGRGREKANSACLQSGICFLRFLCYLNLSVAIWRLHTDEPFCN